MQKIANRIALVTSFLFPLAVAAQTIESYFNATIKPLLDTLINILIVLAVFVLIVGIFRYITAAGDEEQVKQGRTYILYGVIGVALMLLIRGLVNLVVSSLAPGLDTQTPSIEPL